MKGIEFIQQQQAQQQQNQGGQAVFDAMAGGGQGDNSGIAQPPMNQSPTQTGGMSDFIKNLMKQGGGNMGPMTGAYGGPPPGSNNLTNRGGNYASQGGLAGPQPQSPAPGQASQPMRQTGGQQQVPQQQQWQQPPPGRPQSPLAAGGPSPFGLSGPNAPAQPYNRNIGGAGAGSFAQAGDLLDTTAQIESNNSNIFSGVDKDYSGQPGSRSQGFWQIDTPTWKQFAEKAGVDTSQYPDARSAPRDIQRQVASTIPLARFGGRTQNLLAQQYGTVDKSKTLGELNQQFSGGKSQVAQGDGWQVAFDKAKKMGKTDKDASEYADTAAGQEAGGTQQVPQLTDEQAQKLAPIFGEMNLTQIARKLNSDPRFASLPGQMKLKYLEQLQTVMNKEAQNEFKELAAQDRERRLNDQEAQTKTLNAQREANTTEREREFGVKEEMAKTKEADLKQHRDDMKEIAKARVDQAQERIDNSKDQFQKTYDLKAESVRNSIKRGDMEAAAKDLSLAKAGVDAQFKEMNTVISASMNIQDEDLKKQVISQAQQTLKDAQEKYKNLQDEFVSARDAKKAGVTTGGGTAGKTTKNEVGEATAVKGGEKQQAIEEYRKTVADGKYDPELVKKIFRERAKNMGMQPSEIEDAINGMSPNAAVGQ